MNETAVPARSAIAPEHTWNAPSVFASVAAWEAEYKRVQADLPAVRAFQGRLSEGPTVVADAFVAVEDALQRAYKLYVYASMAYAVDTTDQKAAALESRAQGLFGQVAAAISFLDPELIVLGADQLNEWTRTEPRLTIHAHYFDNLFRQQAHVRSAEVEEVLGMLAEPFGAVSTIASMLTDADFKFKPAIAADTAEIELTQGTLDRILRESDREARRTAWENYADQYLAYKNTLASTLVASVKQNVFQMRARRYDSTLEMALFGNNVPLEVFHNLLEIHRKNLPTWHKYWRVRRQALGVDALHPYDIWAPLTAKTFKVPYSQAVDWIAAGLAPMGEDYVAALRQGVLQDRWVDIYPNQGKSAGAFSSGAPGTHPFIMMSY